MGIESFTLANFSITAAVPVIIFFLKLVLDTVGMSTVEKVTLTNFKKFTIYLSHILTLTLISQIALFFFEVPVEISSSAIDPLIINLIALFIIISLAFLSVGLLAKLLSIKISFYITDEQTKDKWFIRRMIANNKLLLSKDMNSFKFIDLDAMNDREIFRVYEKEKVVLGQKFINKHIKIFQIGLAIILMITSVAGWWLSGENTGFDILLNLILLFEYACMMYVFAASNNVKVMKEIDNENISSNSLSN